MNTKPVIITASVFVILVATVLFILYGRSTNKSSDEDGVRQFLSKFSNYAAAGQTDSLFNSFEANGNNKAVERLVNLLAGKTGVNGKSKPLADIAFTLNESTIEISDNGAITATIPVFFSHDKLETKFSSLILKIVKSDNGEYKIMQADARQFLTDFIAYENFVRGKTLSDEDIYDPRTLVAFVKAKQLWAKFDSVVWFSHIQDKTYFYVVNGEWDEYDMLRDTAKKYKMGLVGPALNLIIPVEFDLVGQIGASFPGMIEVQKNKKKGFYDLSGKMVLPVIYDQIFPLEGQGGNIAALRTGDDFYWLKNDFTLSEKTDMKIAEILPTLKKTGSFSMKGGDLSSIIEFNSREQHGSIYLPPSYMVDLNLLPIYKTFKNPLRKQVQYYDVSENYIANKTLIHSNATDSQEQSWFQTVFYSIRDYFLGGRAEFYDRKNVVIVDNKRNRVYATDFPTDFSEMGGESLKGACDINSVKALNDTLFEVKIGSVLYVELYDTLQILTGGPYYHYVTIKNNNLVQSPMSRTFAFTKFVKMDDNYLSGCYVLEKYVSKDRRAINRIDKITPEMLMYMKNEIYADYGYEFKDKRWAELMEFNGRYNRDDGKIVYSQNVTDSLTAIDKYNINFIDQQLKAKKTTTLAAQ